MISKTARRFIVRIRPGCPTGPLLRCPFADPGRASLRVRSNDAEPLLRIGRIIYQPVSNGPAFLQLNASYRIAGQRANIYVYSNRQVGYLTINGQIVTSG